MSEYLCQNDYGLIELLGDYLNDDKQSAKVKENIVLAFSNICAEVNENLKEAIIQRGRILNYFEEAACISDEIIQTVPWLLYNIYCQHVTLLLNTD